MMGKLPMAVPGPSGWWYTGALIDYRPKEPFSAEVRTPLTDASARCSPRTLPSTERVSSHGSAASRSAWLM